jgi:hypothetical protein
MNNKKATIAISQIMILVLGIISFSIFLSGGVRGEEIAVGTQAKLGEDIYTYGEDGKWFSPSNPNINYKNLPSNAEIVFTPSTSTSWVKDYFKDKSFYQGGVPGYSAPSAAITPANKANIFPTQSGEALEISPPGAEPVDPNYAYEWGAKFGGAGYAMTHIVEGLAWSAGVVVIIQIIGGIAGDEHKPLVNALSGAIFGGIMAGKTTYGIAQGLGKGQSIGWGGFSKAGLVSSGIGLGIGIAIFIMMYKKESQEIIKFTCYPWDAPTGGEDCEKCNNQKGGLPCSEYQCRSLGQACELVNVEDQAEMKCVWVNKRDVNPPQIESWEDALLPDYRYVPDKAISPPDRGVIVDNQDSTTGCTKAFTPITFGINTDEPAKCKIDYIRKKEFEEMEFFFGGSSLFKYNHTQAMSLPGPSAEQNSTPILQNNGNYELFVRCMDANGNTNEANFVFKYCVEKGPDTTPPLIVTTNLLNNMPFQFDKKTIDLELYTNEPADCKWSPRDQSYDDMENSMSCTQSATEMNAQMLYTCKTTLTGLKNREDNKFYFRCRDQPTKTQDRNTNSESYEFTLIGTEPLILNEVGPNKTVKDSTESVKITLTAETSAGYDKGKSTCYYSETGKTDTFIMFFETDSHEHSQDLSLLEGDYTYHIKCIDLGGNSDTKTTTFSVESDSSAPTVVRAYKEETRLKIITNEDAECVYDTVDCLFTFEDGLKMITAQDELTEHFADWDTKKNFYIKCKDEYSNQPIFNECSMIVRPYDVFEED